MGGAVIEHRRRADEPPSVRLATEYEPCGRVTLTRPKAKPTPEAADLLTRSSLPPKRRERPQAWRYRYALR
jgi:hypothetical protein